jgi:hypothetical protein
MEQRRRHSQLWQVARVPLNLSGCGWNEGNYDFKQMERSLPGYVVSGEALTRGVFRLFQGDDSTYYDQTVFFYLKISKLATTVADVHATADGPELLLDTSQTYTGIIGAGGVDTVGTYSHTDIVTYTGFGAKPVFRQEMNALLPDGLTLNPATGMISGVPQLEATVNEVEYQVDIVVEAQMEKTGHVFVGSTTQTAKFTLTLSPPLLEAGQSVFAATLGSWYEGPIPSVTGGRIPLVFSYANVSSADLPDGLEINHATGQITGTPTTPSYGEVTMAVLVTDANQATKYLQTIGLTVNPSITVTWTKAPPTSVVDKTYPLNIDLGLNETHLTELVYRLDEGAVLPD